MGSKHISSNSVFCFSSAMHGAVLDAQCFFLDAISPHSNLHMPDCLSYVGYVLKLPYVIHSMQFRERFSLWSKLEKTKIFLWKAICFARLCLYSQYNYCRLYEFENELPSLQPTPTSVWFSHEVIILCLRSKPVAMEINVMLQICYYLWLHCKMDPNEELISDFFTKYLMSHMRTGEGISAFIS